MRQIQTLLLTSVFALVASLPSAPAGAQVVTFQQQWVAPTPGTSFGRASDVDGSTAVVGASVEDSQRGAAYVFVKNGSTGEPQRRLTASDAAPTSQFGTGRRPSFSNHLRAEALHQPRLRHAEVALGGRQ